MEEKGTRRRYISLDGRLLGGYPDVFHVWSKAETEDGRRSFAQENPLLRIAQIRDPDPPIPARGHDRVESFIGLIPKSIINIRTWDSFN